MLRSKVLIFISLALSVLGLAGWIAPAIPTNDLPQIDLTGEVSHVHASSGLALTTLDKKFDLSTLPAPDIIIPDAPQPTPVDQLQNWTLIGIAGTENSQVALVRIENNTRRLTLGDIVDDQIVTSITATSVTLEMGGAERNLSLKP